MASSFSQLIIVQILSLSNKPLGDMKDIFIFFWSISIFKTTGPEFEDFPTSCLLVFPE